MTTTWAVAASSGEGADVEVLFEAWVMAGDGGATCMSGIAPMFSRPPGAVGRFIEEVEVAEAALRIATRVWAADCPGCRAANRTAAPVTCGVAIDVPSREL